MKKIRMISLITVLMLTAALLCGCGDKNDGIAGTWVPDGSAAEAAGVCRALTLKKDSTCSLIVSAGGSSLTLSGTYGVRGSELILQCRVPVNALNAADLADTEYTLLPDENGTFMLTGGGSEFSGSYQTAGESSGVMTDPVFLKRNETGTGGTFTRDGSRGSFTLNAGNLTMCADGISAPYTLRLDDGRVFTMTLDGGFTLNEGEKEGTWTPVQDGWRFTFAGDSVPLTVTVRETGSYSDTDGAAGTYDFEDRTVTLMMNSVTVRTVRGFSREDDTLRIWTLRNEEGMDGEGAGDTDSVRVYKRKK